MYRVALLGLILTGCGGGAFSPTLGFTELFADSFPAPVRNLEGSILDGTRVVRNGQLGVGDTEDDQEIRSFVVFAMPTPASDQVLEGATLKLHLFGRAGNPFQRLGDFHIDLVNIGSSLGAEDASGPRAARVSFSTVDTGDIELDVTPLVQAALDGGAERLDFRLLFETAVSEGGSADMLVFAAYSLESQVLPPTLTLSWSAPE